MQKYPNLPHHFIIVAPAYQVRSGGIMVLHELCDAINRCGHRASIVFITGGSSEKQDFSYIYLNNKIFYKPDSLYFELDESNINSQLSEILENGTVIYPDLIIGNPFGAKRVIRYILNKNQNLDERDYILSYSIIYYDNYNFALPKMFPDPAINNKETVHWTKRNLNITYIGKGESFENCFRIPESILLERDWPRDKEQLSLLLKQCKFFFTWDCVSATNYDAVLCGAVPILLHDKQIERSKINCMEFGSFPKISFTLQNNEKIIVDSMSLMEVDEIDIGLQNIIENIDKLESSWISRVGQFLNNYTLFMCSQ